MSAVNTLSPQVPLLNQTGSKTIKELTKTDHVSKHECIITSESSVGRDRYLFVFSDAGDSICYVCFLLKELFS